PGARQRPGAPALPPMPIAPFNEEDFRVFDQPGFAERMAALRSQIRPKLAELGETLAPDLQRIAGVPLYAHVARHARRTVNPPDDPWVAFGAERRGYKKTPHFKVAISRHCIRFLFEIGPEHPAKAAWARAWRREAPRLRKTLAKRPGLAWFRSEHDEAPAGYLARLADREWCRLAEELVRRRDGEFVIGRRVEAADVVRWDPAGCTGAARATFPALRGCFRLPGRGGVMAGPTPRWTVSPADASPPPAVSALADQVAADGGHVLACYREPLKDAWQLFAILPL